MICSRAHSLYSIYINDLDTDIISNISKFEDDTKIGSRVDKKSGRQSLQNDLNKIIACSKTWQMNFNADKCKIIHFGSKNEGHNYFIEGSILQAANEEKDLGVTVDNTLKFSKQCAEAVKKANKMLGYIARNFEYKSKNIIIP